jgi:hypothetical protein
MGTTIKNAYIGQPGITDTTLFTAGANITARVVKCTATNDTTTATTITFHKVESGAAVGDDKLILNGRALASKETYECPEVVGQVLDAGDLISAIAGDAAQVTVILDVVEIV